VIRISGSSWIEVYVEFYTLAALPQGMVLILVEKKTG